MSDGDSGTIIIDDPILRAGFTHIPNLVFARADLGPGAKLCYMALLSYAWQQGQCFPGQERLAAAIGVSRQRASIYVEQLVAAGLVAVTRRGLGLTNVYRLLSLTVPSTPVARVDNPFHPDVTNRDISLSQIRTTACHKSEQQLVTNPED